MAKQVRRFQPTPLTVGSDPSLWRYDSIDEALTENCDLITQVIRAGEELREDTSASQSLAVHENAETQRLTQQKVS